MNMAYLNALFIVFRTSWAPAESATHIHDTGLISPLSESRTVDCNQFCPLAQDTAVDVLPLQMRWCDIKSQALVDMYNYPSEQTTLQDYWGARDWCIAQAIEMTIVSVHSADENMCVFNICPECFVGLNDYETIGTYIQSDGTPYDYPPSSARGTYPWGGGQPNNIGGVVDDAHGDCAEYTSTPLYGLQDSEWNDWNCDVVRSHTVCKYPCVGDQTWTNLPAFATYTETITPYTYAPGLQSRTHTWVIELDPVAYTDAGVYNFDLTRSRNAVSDTTQFQVEVVDPCADNPALLTLVDPLPAKIEYILFDTCTTPATQQWTDAAVSVEPTNPDPLDELTVLCDCGPYTWTITNADGSAYTGPFVVNTATTPYTFQVCSSTVTDAGTYDLKVTVGLTNYPTIATVEQEFEVEITNPCFDAVITVGTFPRKTYYLSQTYIQGTTSLLWDDSPTYMTCTMPGAGSCNCGDNCGDCCWKMYGTTDSTVAAPGPEITATTSPWSVLSANEINANTALFTDESGCCPVVGPTWPPAGYVPTDWVITVNVELCDYQEGDVVNGVTLTETIDGTPTTFVWEILNPCRYANLDILVGDDICYMLGTTQQTAANLGQNFNFAWDSTTNSVTHDIPGVAHEYCGDYQWFICPGTLADNDMTTCCSAGTTCEDTATFDRDTDRIDFDAALEMSGTALSDPWWYNQGLDLPSAMQWFSTNTAWSGYFETDYTFTIRVQLKDYAVSDNRIFEKNFNVKIKNPCPLIQSASFPLDDADGCAPSQSFIEARTTAFECRRYYLGTDPEVWLEPPLKSPNRSGSNTSILDYFGHNLKFCGPLGMRAYFNDTTTALDDRYWPNPVTQPAAYMNETDTTASFWTNSYGLGVGQVDYPFVPCIWQANCYDPNNYVLSIWTDQVRHVGNHTVYVQAYLQDYVNEIFSVFVPFCIEIISCEPGTLLPSYIPNFYYHYGQDLQTTTFEEFVHQNATPTWGCQFDWEYYAAVIDPDPKFINNTRYDIRIDGYNYSDYVLFEENANRTFTFSEIERMHKKMTAALEMMIRVCGYIQNATEEVCTEFTVYMDPNLTVSLKDPIAQNDLCNRPWKKPSPLPTEIIVIQRDQEPEFAINVPTDMVNKYGTGLSWSFYCGNALATVSLIGGPSFITLQNDVILINPFRGADSGWHTFKIWQKNPLYPQQDQETLVRIQVACLTDCESVTTPFFVKPPTKSLFKTYGATWIYQLPKVVDPRGKVVEIRLNTQPTLGEEFIQLEQFGWDYQLVIQEKDPREFMGRIILDLTLVTSDGREAMYSVYLIIEDSSAYAEQSWGAYQYQIRQFERAQHGLKNRVTKLVPPQIDPLRVFADELGNIEIGFDQVLEPGQDFQYSKHMMRLAMPEGEGIDSLSYSGEWVETKRQLQTVDVEEDAFYKRNNFTWKFVSLTEDGIKLKVDFDEPTAVSRTPMAKDHIAVTFATGDWLLSAESALFVKDGTTVHVAMPPQFESNSWLRWVKVLLAFTLLCLVLSLCVVIVTSYTEGAANRRFWPMYHALQVVVALTLYEERLPPLVIWFVEWLRDIIQLNVIPRKYLTTMLSTGFFRVLYNAGGMMLLFSVPIYFIVWGIVSCAKSRSYTRTGKFFNSVHQRMTYDGLIRLGYVNYLPLCLAAGVGRQLGSHEVEGYGMLLLLVLPPLLITLALGVYGEPAELKATSFLNKYGEAYSEYRFTSDVWNALFACFWLLRRVIFTAFLRISFFVIRLSFYLILQAAVFAYHGLLPYRSKWTQGIEFFNEAIISALMCLLFGFSDPRPAPFSQQTIGWVYVGLIALLVYVNTYWIVYVWLKEYCERKRLLDEARRQKHTVKVKEEQLPPVPVYSPPNKSYKTSLAVIDEQSDDDKYQSEYPRKQYASIDVKTPAETPNLTFVDAPEEMTQSEDRSVEEVEEEFDMAIAPESLVYIFLKINLFRNRVEIFQFFLKSWMPYQEKCSSGAVLWQQRCLEKGIKREDLRMQANMLWRRDFSEDMEGKEMSTGRAKWVQNWEYETLQEVNERSQRYITLLKKENDQQSLEAFSYERKLIKKKVEPDVIWMVKRELYYPGDDRLQ